MPRPPRYRLETDETVELPRAEINKAKLVLTDALIAFTTQPKVTN